MPSVPNLRTNVLLRSEDSDGHVSLVENVVPPHSAGPPLHRHDFDEAFYLLEGQLIFQVGDVLVTKGAGELAFAPRNVAHALANRSDVPARYLLVCTPAAVNSGSLTRSTVPIHVGIHQLASPSSFIRAGTR